MADLPPTTQTSGLRKGTNSVQPPPSPVRVWARWQETGAASLSSLPWPLRFTGHFSTPACRQRHAEPFSNPRGSFSLSRLLSQHVFIGSLVRPPAPGREFFVTMHSILPAPASSGASWV